MILVDTFVWIDHLRRVNRQLSRALTASAVLVHPFVVGELACGTLPNAAMVLANLASLPQAPVARQEEALGLVKKSQSWRVWYWMG